MHLKFSTFTKNFSNPLITQFPAHLYIQNYEYVVRSVVCESAVSKCGAGEYLWACPHSS